MCGNTLTCLSVECNETKKNMKTSMQFQKNIFSFSGMTLAHTCHLLGITFRNELHGMESAQRDADTSDSLF